MVSISSPDGGKTMVHSHAPPWKVELQYFKPSGKFYSSGEYESEREHVFQIAEEVREMRDSGGLPGLQDGPGKSCYTILIRSDHYADFPVLIMGDRV